MDWCDARGFAKHDPNNYDAATIQKFFDDFEAGGIMSAPGSSAMPTASPPAMQSMEGWNNYMQAQMQAQQAQQQAAEETPAYLLEAANAQLMQMGGMDAGAMGMMAQGGAQQGGPQQQQGLPPTMGGFDQGAMAMMQAG